MMQPVRKVVVVGRDGPAWMAALSLQRALGRAGLEVSVVELPSLLRGADVYAALPSLRSLHDLLGLDEAAVLTAARGVPMVAQRYSEWTPGAAFLQGYDSVEAPGAFLSFVQLWAKARIKGLPVPFEEFSYGAMAARLGRVPSESDDPEALGATYGYHLDANAYSLLLRTLSERRGIKVRSTPIADVEISEDRILAIELADGQRIEADLFVDASGAEAVLISRLPQSAFEAWDAFLPCDRLLAASAPRLSPLPAFSQVTAFDAGWAGMFPLQERTAVVAAYRSTEIGDDELLHKLKADVGMPVEGDAVVSTIAPGVRKSPWIGNCVAVADAAAFLEPLDSLQLHMAHVCVTQLINFFPVDSDTRIEATDYNAAVRLHASNLRDFQQSHYKLNRRTGQRLWDEARSAEVSDGLAQKLRVFQARSEAVLYDEETFEAGSWASMFIGHGLTPEGYDPRADLIEEQDHIERIQARLREIAGSIPALPTIEAFLTATQIPVKAPAPAS
ncbi:MAG: tryptophan 7-halogenase [Sphingomicrobium sp.]